MLLPTVVSCLADGLMKLCNHTLLKKYGIRERIKQKACLQITITFQLFVEFLLWLPQLNTNKLASWRENKWRKESDLRRSPGHLHLPLKTESTVSI